MTKPVLLEEKPICIAELKDELEKIKKRDNELGFRAIKTEEYLNEFSPLSLKKAKELREKLEGLKITRMKEEYMIKILDTLPKNMEEVKALLQGYVVSVNQEDMKKIADAVKEFV